MRGKAGWGRTGRGVGEGAGAFPSMWRPAPRGKTKAGVRVCLAAGLAVLAAAPQVSAETWATPNYAKVNTERWRCRLCPFDAVNRGRGGIRAGIIEVEDAVPRFGRDSGLDEAGAYADLEGRYRGWDAQGRTLALHARDLGLDSRSARLSAGEGRRWRLGLSHRGIPRVVAKDGRSPYSGRDVLSLPQDWVPAADTARMSTLVKDSRSFAYATRRRENAAEIGVELHPEWRLEVDYSRATKRGREETYADFSYQSTGLPRPVDFRSESLGARVIFDRDPMLLVGELHTARFRNRDRALEWENPWLGPAVASGRKALAPDNEAHGFSLHARVDLDARSVANAALSWGETTQDDAFLPYTTNGALALDPLPSASLDGRVLTFAGTFSLVSQLTRRLRARIEHRHGERENRTRNLTLTPVLGDLVALSARESRIYEFDREKTGLRLQYRANKGLALAAGAERRQVHRRGLEIAENEEDRLWVEIRTGDPRGLRLRIRRTVAARDASQFRATTANHPLTRRFYQAERDRREWKARADYRIDALGLSLGLEFDRRENRYPDSVLGLLRDESRGFGIDASWTPGERITLSANLLAEERDSETAGSVSFDSPPWRYETDDRVITTGLALDLRGVVTEKLDLSLAYARSDGLAGYATEIGDGLSLFPDLISDHREWDLSARYRLRKDLRLVARLRREHYRSADWAMSEADQDILRNVLSLGRVSPNYTNHFIGLSLEAALK